MAVIPRGAVLFGIDNIRKLLTRRNRTLGDAVHTIHRICVVLSEPMPVDAGAIRFHLVDNADFDFLNPKSCKLQCITQPPGD